MPESCAAARSYSAGVRVNLLPKGSSPSGGADNLLFNEERASRPGILQEVVAEFRPAGDVEDDREVLTCPTPSARLRTAQGRDVSMP